MFARLLLAVFFLGLLAPTSYAQATRAQPYNAQLRTDPAVGNIQGIQRYGRSLKTDPDEGEGFSYHVYPIQDAPSVLVGAAGPQRAGYAQTGGIVEHGRALQRHLNAVDEARATSKVKLLELFNELPKERKDALRKQLIGEGLLGETQDFTTFFVTWGLELKRLEELERGIKPIKEEFQKARLEAETDRSQLHASMALTAMQGPGGAWMAGPGYYPPPVSPYPPPFNSTDGLRNFPGAAPGGPPSVFTPSYRGFLPTGMGVGVGVGAGPESLLAAGPLTAALAVGADVKGGLIAEQIYHQPLIQVKVRVIEVERNDELAVSSILDYISNQGRASLITGNNINNNQQRTTAVTRFPGAMGLIGFPTMGTPDLTNLTGAGLLVNLTTEHINFIARLLATEFNADTVTAPEVVTLNGQNVEFVAGTKTPFQLGQNVTSGNTMNVQQLFYKHTGTYISVTPKIVNWGFHGEGEGEVPLVAGDVHNWYGLLTWMVGQDPTSWSMPQVVKGTKPDGTTVLGDDPNFGPRVVKASKDKNTPVPLDIKSWALDQLKRYTKRELADTLSNQPQEDQPIIVPCHLPDGCGCNWKPEDCTIDLAVIVRLSEPGTVKVDQLRTDGNGTFTVSTTSENNVRAVANIIQVKSGHGVVMAGLIGERDFIEISKVPVIGDIPVVGALFRSTHTGREKTEVLVFIEAQVLDPRPDAARVQSATDFRLGQPFVAGDFLDNPLEFGMYRAGFGPYLPPHSKEENIFWERLGRKVRKAATELDDIFLR
jgi:hypothetical protein